ncbi:12704_t:CDS:1 [Racocetra fulgida]|uniref:12704_t:CDS:1 n=1 Tax=Racocetra fulgida TaxID=60492 RepID=A0A9N9JB88_9GLOM|nr:12704_t:CDS:1 [Racocetra fulgida]
MSQQNFQLKCSICLKTITNYRNITNNLKFKIDNCPDKEYYQQLQPNIDKLCFNCYMRIINSYQCQISTINRNDELNSLIEINLTEISKFNSPTNLIEVDDLMKISRSNSPTTLIENNNLVNLIELIKIQKEELIKNNLNEINQ